MGIFSSASKSPAPVQAPQHCSDLFRNETAEMGKITDTVNRLNQATFQAVNLARHLKNDKSLTPQQREQASEAKAVLKAKYELVTCLAGELSCFNKTFDTIAKQLVKARDAIRKSGALLVPMESLRTRDGYCVPWLQNEVVRHRDFVTQVAKEGVGQVEQSLSQINRLARLKGMPQVNNVSESWRSATAL